MRRFSEATTQQPKGLYSNLPVSGVVGDGEGVEARE